MIKTIRQIHFYLGVFFAPSIIFFAFTGMLQTFSIHEQHQGKPGVPWVTALAEVHKNQRVPESWTGKEKPVEAPKPPPAAMSVPAAAAPKAEAGAILQAASKPVAPRPAGPPRRAKSFPLKVFVGLMGWGLIISSLLGIYMAFKYSRGVGLIVGLLILGTVLPAVLLYL